MKTLIIPDLHNCIEKAEKIIKYESADQVVFLGDYFDDFGDDYRIALETAEWLGSSLEKPNRIHLFGNHDISYAFGHKSYKCSGYEAGKDYAINSVLKENDWRKLKLFTYVDGFLCSHAGLHNYVYHKYANGRSINDFLKQECDLAINMGFDRKPAHPLLWAGMSRGGTELYGGIVWCDSSEFIGIDGVNQIFGHTPRKKPMWLEYGNPDTPTFSKNLALDNVGHSNYYAVYENKAISIKWIGDM